MIANSKCPSVFFVEVWDMLHGSIPGSGLARQQWINALRHPRDGGLKCEELVLMLHSPYKIPI